MKKIIAALIIVTSVSIVSGCCGYTTCTSCCGYETSSCCGSSGWY